MATDAGEVEEVCPSIEILTQNETAIPCTVQGCSRIFPNSPCLRMHLVKTHGFAKSSEEKTLYIRGQNKSPVRKDFYCPVKFCVRGKGTKRPFSRMSQLKQHYMTVHAEKKNVCGKCGRGFGLPDACYRHELKCGQLFTCSCGCPYTTVEALFTHAKRQMHSLPDCYLNKKKTSTPSVPNTVSPVVKPAVTVPSTVNSPKTSRKTFQRRLKLYLILPKGLAAVTETNENSGCSASQHVVTKAAQTQTPHEMHSTHTQTPTQPTNKDQACNSYTQTPSLCTTNQQFHFSDNAGNFVTGFNQASVGTQVAMLASQCNLGVGTDDSFLAQLGCFNSNRERQHFELNESIPQTSQVQQLPPISSFVTGQDRTQYLPVNGNSIHGLGVDSMCLNTQTQTNLTSSDLPLSDFRILNNTCTQTQTCSLDPVPLEDNETQTLISVLGIDSSNSTDSGTQTQCILDDLFGPQDIELTESQTQTWFTDYTVSASDLESSGQDFVDKTLDDLVDIHTQTSLGMSDFSQLVDDITFANSQTQTLRSDLGCSSLLSSGVQTDFPWLCMPQSDGQVRHGSVACASSQTQTQQRFVDQDSVMSSVETQT